MSDIREAEAALGPEIDAMLGEEAGDDGEAGAPDVDAEAALADEIEAELTEQDGEADDDDDATGDDDGADGEGDEDEALVEPEPDMPRSWSKEDAKVWATMTPDQRAIVNRREVERDNYLRRVGMEASQVKQTVENEARDVLARMHEHQAAKLAAYSKLIVAPPPDESLLYTGNQDDVLQYQRQQAAHRRSLDQQQELHRQIEQEQAAAEAARQQAHQAEIASDAQRLKDQLPEWFDPSEGPKLQERLQSIGSELGYPPELMRQATSSDILALKTAADWKAKASKWDELQKRKMEGVRAAKRLPRMTRPGVTPSKGQVSAQAKEQAWEKVKATKDPNAFADFIGL